MIQANLLARALSLTGLQTVKWFAATGRTTNSIGLDVTAFAASVLVTGSLQPLPRSAFQNMGLDYARQYVMFYATTPMADLQRDASGDQFEFAGNRYQLVTNTEWYPINGWNGSLAVLIGPATS